MKKTTSNSFFMRLSSHGNFDRDIFNRLAIAKCRELGSLREHDQLKNMTQYVDGELGRYYLATASDDLDTLTNIDISRIKSEYVPRVLLTLPHSLIADDPDRAKKVLLESQKWAMKHNDAYCVLESQRHIAIADSISGNHWGALKVLNDGFRLAKEVSRFYPTVYGNYLNSIAVELVEIGQLRTAHQFNAIALQSQYALNFPGWFETADEIAQKLRPPSKVQITVPLIPKLHIVKRTPKDQALIPTQKTDRTLHRFYTRQAGKALMRRDLPFGVAFKTYNDLRPYISADDINIESNDNPSPSPAIGDDA